jgi:hypothetical protein
MAGWVPYWRDRLDDAEALFQEALDVCSGDVLTRGPRCGRSSASQA